MVFGTLMLNSLYFLTSITRSIEIDLSGLQRLPDEQTKQMTIKFYCRLKYEHNCSLKQLVFLIGCISALSYLGDLAKV